MQEQENQVTQSEAKLEQAQNAALNYLLHGDISQMNPQQQQEFCAGLCRSLGLNPLTRPFEFIRLNGKLQPYAKKDATDQLRKIYHVSIEITQQDVSNGICTVTAKATLPNGRSDSDTGAVSVGNLKGDALCNAIMKTVTKAKRRVTLSICGLGVLDESEIETIPAHKVDYPRKTPASVRSAHDQIEYSPENTDWKKMLISLIAKMTSDFSDENAIQSLKNFWDTDNVKKAISVFESEGILKEKYEELSTQFLG